MKIFAKKPTKGGIPPKEKKTKTLESDQILFVLKKFEIDDKKRGDSVLLLK